MVAFEPPVSRIKYSLIVISLGVIFLYLQGFYIEPQDIKIYIHDNLDSSFSMYKLLADTGTFFSPNHTVIPNVMNGLSRVSLPSELNVLSLLYFLFEPIHAYMLNEAFIRLIAFFGMTLLLSSYYISNKDKHLIIVIGTSLLFALLPYYSNGGASIAGQPLVLYAFLNLRNNNKDMWSWLILAIFPFYSSLFLAGIFVLFMLALIGVYDSATKRKVNVSLFMALLLMSGLYLLAEYRLLINILDPIFISHRQEFFFESLSFQGSLVKSMKLFFSGQYHAHSIHQYYIIPVVVLSALTLMIKEGMGKYIVVGVSIVSLVILVFSYTGRIHLEWVEYFYSYINIHKRDYALFGLMGASLFLITTSIFIYKKQYIASVLLFSIVFISFVSGFEDYESLIGIKDEIPILNQVQFDRFYFLFPLLWFLLFAVTSKIIDNRSKYGVFFILFIIVQQGYYSFTMQNGEKWRKPVSVKQFYSQSVYDEVKDFIHKPVSSYRVISIGLHPSIAIYNGFYTLDAYIPNYALEYKHEFRKVIAEELDKSERAQKYFDNWGSRCRLMGENKNITLNLNQLKEMGAEYILSSYDVNINNGTGILFMGEFSEQDSMYDIYLYKVK